MTDYKERQRKLRERREAEGYYTQEAVAARAEAAVKRAEYNERIAKVAAQTPKKRGKA